MANTVHHSEKRKKKPRNVNISAFIQISGNISRIKANDTLVLHAFFVEATYRQRQLNITRFLKEGKKTTSYLLLSCHDIMIKCKKRIIRMVVKIEKK
jgi:hypothetical protein